MQPQDQILDKQLSSWNARLLFGGSMVRDPTPTKASTLAHCAPSNEWGPREDTREVRAERK